MKVLPDNVKNCSLADERILRQFYRGGTKLARIAKKFGQLLAFLAHFHAELFHTLVARDRFLRRDRCVDLTRMSVSAGSALGQSYGTLQASFREVADCWRRGEN
jgi:hypothetical protein